VGNEGVPARRGLAGVVVGPRLPPLLLAGDPLLLQPVADHRAERRAQRRDHAAFECVVVADDPTPEILSGLSGDILVRKQARSVRPRLLKAGRPHKHRQNHGY